MIAGISGNSGLCAAMEDIVAQPLATKKEKKKSKKEKQEEKKERKEDKEKIEHEQGDDILMGSQSDGEDNTGNIIKNLLKKKTNSKLTTTNENLHKSDNQGQSQYRKVDDPRSMQSLVAAPMMGGYQPNMNHFRGSTFPLSTSMPMGFPRQMEPMHDGTIQIHIDVKIQKKGDSPAEKYTKMIPKYKFHDGDNLFISLREFILFLVSNFLPPPIEEEKNQSHQQLIKQSISLPTVPAQEPVFQKQNETKSDDSDQSQGRSQNNSQKDPKKVIQNQSPEIENQQRFDTGKEGELPLLSPSKKDPIEVYEIVLLPTHSIVTELHFIEPGDKIKLRDKMKGINHFNIFADKTNSLAQKVSKGQNLVKTELPCTTSSASNQIGRISIENPENESDSAKNEGGKDYTTMTIEEKEQLAIGSREAMKLYDGNVPRNDGCESTHTLGLVGGQEFNETIDPNIQPFNEYFAQDTEDPTQRQIELAKEGQKKSVRLQLLITFQEQMKFYQDPENKKDLVPTPSFQDYNLKNCSTRWEVMAWVRDISLKAGFKALCPFNDRTNVLFTCITMMCSMCASMSKAKSNTNCPFKLTYLKLHHEQFYRLVGFTQTFIHHNHQLPLEGVFINGKPTQAFSVPSSFVGGGQPTTAAARNLLISTEELKNLKKQEKGEHGDLQNYQQNNITVNINNNYQTNHQHQHQHSHQHNYFPYKNEENKDIEGDDEDDVVKSLASQDDDQLDKEIPNSQKDDLGEGMVDKQVARKTDEQKNLEMYQQVEVKNETNGAAIAQDTAQAASINGIGIHPIQPPYNQYGQQQFNNQVPQQLGYNQQSSGPYWGQAPGLPYMGQPGGSHFQQMGHMGNHLIQPVPFNHNAMQQRPQIAQQQSLSSAAAQPSETAKQSVDGLKKGEDNNKIEEQKKPKHRKLGEKPARSQVFDKSLMKKQKALIEKLKKKREEDPDDKKALIEFLDPEDLAALASGVSLPNQRKNKKKIETEEDKKMTTQRAIAQLERNMKIMQRRLAKGKLPGEIDSDGDLIQFEEVKKKRKKDEEKDNNKEKPDIQDSDDFDPQGEKKKKKHKKDKKKKDKDKKDKKDKKHKDKKMKKREESSDENMPVRKSKRQKDIQVSEQEKIWNDIKQVEDIPNKSGSDDQVEASMMPNQGGNSSASQ